MLETSTDHSFFVKTPFGTVCVTATSSNHVHVSASADQPLTINRVQWRASFHMNDYGTGFEMSKENGRLQEWYLDRTDYRLKSTWESERKAKDKIEATIPTLVAAALESKRDLLRGAELEGLRDRYRTLSAEVDELEVQLAAKRKELETICLASIEVESEERKLIRVIEIPLTMEVDLVAP